LPPVQGLFYLIAGGRFMTERQNILLLDDDAAITEGLALGLQREGRTVITCSDLESAQLMVERLRLAYIVTDVRLTGPFAFEGLDFIRHATRHSPASKVILMTGNGSEELQQEATNRGAFAFLNKPFSVDELEAMFSDAGEDMDDSPQILRIPTLEQILTSNTLSPAFQPIVKLSPEGETIFGFESLARFPTDTPFRNPELLFQYAHRMQRTADLEMKCLQKSFETGAGLALTGLLFMNIHPVVFSNLRRLPEFLAQLGERFEVPLDRVVLEITEQAGLGKHADWESTAEALSSKGVRFAFDDVGVAYSHLMHIQQIKPAFLKISQDFGTSFESDATKTRLVRNILSLAEDFGSKVILEGIESAATRDAAVNLGIPYGQGYFFGRPASPSTFIAGALLSVC
jgi:EAL domain-containing protein (putative c-di-GMP-specific phosphodiesterase class I)/ActR/RegA family two-component response regulator